MAELMGDGLVRLGAMRAEELEKVLAAQKAGDSRRFGEIAVAMGFLTQDAIKSWEIQKKK